MKKKILTVVIIAIIVLVVVLTFFMGNRNASKNDLPQTDETSKESESTSEVTEENNNVVFSQGLEYVIVNGSCTITGLGTCTDTEIIIPEMIDGVPVRTIGYCALQSSKDVVSITIPNSVTSIAMYAFGNCSNLTSINIPDRVTSLDGSMFSGCTSLDKIEISDTNTIYCTVNGVLFSKDQKTLIAYPGVMSTYEIPDCVTSIGKYAFYHCDSLTSVTIPDSVTKISDYAFQRCISLASIVIPDSVTSIGNNVFDNCRSLLSIDIPNSVKNIGQSAFYGCNNLTSVTIPDSVTSIGERAFYGCSGLTSVEIPDSVTSIGYYAFHGCSSLTSITIPGSVASIPNGESYGSVYHIGVFSNCTNLRTVIIENGVESIGTYAFFGCSSLTSVYYGGDETKWAKISIDSYNSSLTSATRYYYSATQPTTSGNYWHYVDGKPTPW